METKLLARSLETLKGDLVDDGILKAISALQQSYATLANSPTDAATQKQLAETLTVLRKSLASAATQDLPVSLKTTLHQASLTPLTAPAIALALEGALAQPAFAPAVTAESLQDLYKNLSSRWLSANHILAGLKDLGIDDSETTRDIEAGILLPTTYTNDDLRVLNSDLRDWTGIIDTLDEIATGKTAPTIRVTALSSGSFDIFLAPGKACCAGLLVLMRGVYRAIQVGLDADRKIEELREIGYANSVIEAAEQDKPNLIKRIKEETINAVFELLQEKLGSKNGRVADQGRGYELKTRLNFGFDFALSSVNRGVDVEVTTPRELPETEAAEEIAADLLKRIAELEREVRTRANKLPERSKPLLELEPPQRDSGSPH